MPKLWKKWKPLDRPETANLEILSIVQDSNVQSRLIYRIRLLCCGHEREMRHMDIVKRQREINANCIKCRGTGGGENKGLKLNRRFVDPPDWWLPPPSVLTSVRPGWKWS